MEIRKKRVRLIGDRAFYKMVLRIAIPIMVQNGITNMIGLVNNITVGKMGTEQLAGVAIANQLISIFNMCVFGAVSGAGIFGAQFQGKQDYEGVRHVFRLKVILMLVLSALAVGLFAGFGKPLIAGFLHEGSDGSDLALTLKEGYEYLLIMLVGFLPYGLSQAYSSTLREADRTVVPMRASIYALVLGVVLNYLLIPVLGVAGAALATVVSRFAELGMNAWWTHTHPEEVPFVLGAYHTLKVPGDLVKQVLIKGTPLLLNETLWSVGFTVVSQTYSYHGVAVVAAVNIATTIANLVNVLFSSMGASIGIIIGNMLGAGEVIEDVYDCYPDPKPEQVVVASVARINARVGMNIPGEEMVRILNALSFKTTLDGDTLTAIVPDFREDIEGEADLSEEVLRIYGYEHIESTMLRGQTSTGTRNIHMQLSDRVSRILASKGLYEVRNFSFVSPKLIDKLGLDSNDSRMNQLKLINPLGEDTSVMRSTLVPSVLNTVSLNQNRNNETAMLYEIAPVFDVSERKAGDLPHEQPSLCIGAYGKNVDFYLIRDIVMDMLAQFGLHGDIIPGAEPYHHPGRAAKIMIGEACIATVAELHPNTMAAFGITRRTIIAEVNLEMLCRMQKKMEHVHALPKFPAVTRDIALVMDETTTVGSVLHAIRHTGGALLEKAEMFDIYRGAQLLPGKKSVAFSLTFRNPDRTLSDDDVNPLMQKILAVCEAECGASLRL